MSTEAGRLAAYADLVAALLDLRDPGPSAAFDAAVDAAVADSSLTPEQARHLRWLQRQTVRQVVEHARSVLPSTLMALEGEHSGGTSTLPDDAAPDDAAPDDSPPPTVGDEPEALAPSATLQARRLLVAGLRPLPDSPTVGPFPSRP